jgi:hypothetical protein
MRSIPCRHALALLAGSLLLQAQDPASNLQIAILEGGGARNSSLAEQAKPVTVEIRNAAGQPLPDATVTAILPPTGPGAAFSWGTEISTKQTGSDGRVTFSGMRLRKQAGEFPIRLIASAGGHTSSITAMQSVSTDEPAPVVKPKRWSNRRIAILTVVAAGVAAGLVVAFYHGNSSQTTGSSAGITVGVPTVTGPQ